VSRRSPQLSRRDRDQFTSYCNPGTMTPALMLDSSIQKCLLVLVLPLHRRKLLMRTSPFRRSELSTSITVGKLSLLLLMLSFLSRIHLDAFKPSFLATLLCRFQVPLITRRTRHGSSLRAR
jgi:hypothetical protein